MWHCTMCSNICVQDPRSWVVHGGAQSAHATHRRWVSIGRRESRRQFVHNCWEPTHQPLIRYFLTFKPFQSVPMDWKPLSLSLKSGQRPLLRSLWHSVVFPEETDVSQNILWPRLSFKRLDWCVCVLGDWCICVSRDWCVKIFSLFISNLVSTLLHPHLSINVRPFATPPSHSSSLSSSTLMEKSPFQAWWLFRQNGVVWPWLQKYSLWLPLQTISNEVFRLFRDALKRFSSYRDYRPNAMITISLLKFNQTKNISHDTCTTRPRYKTNKL